MAWPTLLLLCLVALLSAAGCRGTQRTAVPLRVGVPALEQSALLYVAAAQGLFKANGLTVDVADFATGPAAIAAAVGGDIDIAGTAELPFVTALLSGADLRILAVSDRFENDYLVVRTDRGIRSAIDLKGKTIGVAQGTIAEFYLGQYLALNGIAVGDVNLTNASPSDFQRTLTAGGVDAMVAWQPYVNRMVASAPRLFEAWRVQNDQPVYGLLVCTSAWLRDHTATVTSFLKSLAAAEAYLERRPADARSIVSSRLGYEEGYLPQVWQNHEFALTLDFSLVLAMENEARWYLSNQLQDGRPIPQFGQYVYLDGLREVAPHAVNTMD